MYNVILNYEISFASPALNCRGFWTRPDFFLNFLWGLSTDIRDEL
jgi:hypothetical protein